MLEYKRNKYGYLDLNDDESIKSTDSGYKLGHKYIVINGELYYFKPLISKKIIYEILGSHIARLLGLNAVEYDIALYGNRVGAI